MSRPISNTHFLITQLIAQKQSYKLPFATILGAADAVEAGDDDDDDDCDEHNWASRGIA
jgi:hypothetical protein